MAIGFRPTKKALLRAEMAAEFKCGRAVRLRGGNGATAASSREGWSPLAASVTRF